MAQTDAQLVDMSLNGDKKAFGTLVDRYHRRVCGIAFSQLRNFQDAEDAAQETFIAAYRSLPKLASADKFVIRMKRCRPNNS